MYFQEIIIKRLYVNGDETLIRIKIVLKIINLNVKNKKNYC